MPNLWLRNQRAFKVTGIAYSLGTLLRRCSRNSPQFTDRNLVG